MISTVQVPWEPGPSIAGPSIEWKEEYRYNPKELTKYIRRANRERIISGDGGPRSRYQVVKAAIIHPHPHPHPLCNFSHKMLGQICIIIVIRIRK